MAAAFVPAETTIKMSETIVNNERIAKVDCIARIDIYGFWYFTVFRRYNSPYDILVEDIHRNIVLLERSSIATIRGIVQQLRGLTAYDAALIYIANNYSVEFGSSITDIARDALDISLIEVQKQYSALYLNLEGVTPSLSASASASTTDEIAAEGLLALKIPKSDPEVFYQSPSDENDLSMRVADVTLRVLSIIDEINELVDEISAHDKNCMVLRSGRRVYKN
jgi:hypothetical protein